MSPRPRGRSFGRQNSANPTPSLNRTPSALYRIRTPLEHVDSIVVYEEDHDPHDSPSTSRNVSPSRVPDTARLTGFPLASPLHEEEEEARQDHFVGRTDTEVSSNDTIAAGPDNNELSAGPNRTSADPEKQIRQRQGWTGERNDADERARIRAVEQQERGPKIAQVSEKIVEEGGVPDPRTRKWKDDIVTFNTKDDPDNPKNWSYRRKVLITMLFGTTTMCSTFASSVFSSASPYISEEFGVGRQVVVLGISLFIAGYILGPLLWSSLSEQYGRKMTILVPVFIFMCFTAATATAKDLQTIFITRFFGGVFASSPVTIVGGGLSDMFDQKERGAAVVFYSLMVVGGPCLGPLVGASVSQSYLGWRWTMYLTVILTGFVLAIDIFVLPETFAPAILSRKARHLRLETRRWALHSRHEERNTEFGYFVEQYLTLPLRMIATEPMVTCITIYNSFAYGILYMLFGAIPIVYEENRGWSPVAGTLPFLSVLTGCFIAAAINITYSNTIFRRALENSEDGRAEPEMRLPPMMVGAITFPIGFFIVGWTSQPSTHWFPSVLGFAFIGMSFLLIFQAGLNYLIDSYTSKAASAVAANTFLRSIFAAGLPFAASPLFHNIGINWACTLLGCVSLLLGGLPYLFWIFGPRLRARSTLIDFR